MDCLKLYVRTTIKNFSMNLYHLDCLKLVSPLAEKVVGHCLLVQTTGKLILIDVGIGLLDTAYPEKRIGTPLIEMAGFRFDASLTAWRQIENLGLNPANVTDCIISHLDPDHIGGLADFPNATLHVSEEEFQNFYSGNPRYLALQLEHHPPVVTYKPTENKWFDFEARKVDLGPGLELYLVPLFGHTLGHCGVALQHNGSWLFYIADAYYMREELGEEPHPVKELAEMQADSNTLRLDTLQTIKTFIKNHPEVPVFSYHDSTELAAFEASQSWVDVKQP